MIIKTKLLAAGAALLLSAGSAMAVPATAETDLNVRSGPGTQFPVIGTLSGGETVDVATCSGGWCQVSFSGGTGYASRNHLAMGGAVAPGSTVVVSPSVYDDGYYGYTYGPAFGFYAGPRFHHRHHGWRGHHRWEGVRTGTWQSQGNWSGNRGTWRGGNRIGSAGGNINRAPGGPQVSAPVGLGRGGGAVGGANLRAGGGAPAAGTAVGATVGRAQGR